MKVVGINRGISKKTEKPYTVIHVVGKFEDYMSDNSIGQKAENVYVSKDVDVKVGDEIVFEYGVGFKGMAVVIDVHVLQNNVK